MNSHLGGAQDLDGNTWMPDVWGYLIVKYQVESVLDIGCGFGHAQKWFEQFLISTTGVEGHAETAARHVLGRVVQHDYTLGSAPLGDARFDLCWCAEFVEHVEERFIDNYVKDMARCAVVCLTHGEPRQDGYHHVNCQTDEFWIHALRQRGFTFNPRETATLRKTDRWKAGWGRRTLMVFWNNEIPLKPLPFYTEPTPIY